MSKEKLERYMGYLYSLNLPSEILIKFEANTISLYIRQDSKSYIKLMRRLKDELFKNNIQYAVIRVKEFINIRISIEGPKFIEPHNRHQKLTYRKNYKTHRDYREISLSER